MFFVFLSGVPFPVQVKFDENSFSFLMLLCVQIIRLFECGNGLDCKKKTCTEFEEKEMQ